MASDQCEASEAKMSKRTRREGEQVKPRQREAVGRYVEVGAATVPGDHLLPLGPGPARSSIIYASVEDPNPSLRGRRQKVAVNKSTDPLEMEYAGIGSARRLIGRQAPICMSLSAHVRRRPARANGGRATGSIASSRMNSRC